MMNIEVSVIIPVYNGAPFVKKAYSEIQNQQLENIELIFVDNNSSDNTALLLNELAEADKSIRILKETTQGAAAARNKGIKAARGEFVYFFDVDDELMPEALPYLLSLLKDHPEADSIFGLSTRKRNFKQDNPLTKPLVYSKPFWGLYWFNNFSTLTGTPSFLHRKRVFDKIGLFPEMLLLGEDAAFHIKLGLNCELLHTNKVVFYYHRHENSTVSQNNQKRERVYTYWEQYIKFYIPYYFNKFPDKQLGILLRQKIFLAMIRILQNESTFKSRSLTYNQLKKDINSLVIPYFLRLLFTIFTFFPLTLYTKVMVKIIKTMYPDTINLQKANK